MATIVVEDGTGKTNSNSYVSEADFSTYATDRGVTIAGTAAVLLIQAMDYIESQMYKGYKYTEAQALQWPRGNVTIDGYYVAVTTIPQLLIDAQCEVAIGIDGGTNPLANATRSTKSEKVGDIAVEYMDGARDSTYLAAAESKLSKLLSGGSGGVNAVATRA
jgi:hypothetical protein